MAAGLGMLNRPVVSVSLHIQRTKEKRGNEGGGGRATHGKIEEKTGDESQLSSVRRKASWESVRHKFAWPKASLSSVSSGKFRF